MRRLRAGALGRPRGAGKLSHGGEAAAVWRGGLTGTRAGRRPEPASQRGHREVRSRRGRGGRPEWERGPDPRERTPSASAQSLPVSASGAAASLTGPVPAVLSPCLLACPLPAAPHGSPFCIPSPRPLTVTLPCPLTCSVAPACPPPPATCGRSWLSVSLRVILRRPAS